MKMQLRGIPFLFSILLVSALFIARSDNPPFGKTGAPGEGFCGDCHVGGQSIEAIVELDGLPNRIEANTTYSLTLHATNPNSLAAKAGFQLVALNSNHENTGILSNPGISTEIASNNLRTYLEHKPAKEFSDNDSISWTFDWTSPAGPFGDELKLYTIVLFANGNDYITGDRMVTNQWTTNLLDGFELPEITFSVQNTTCINEGSILTSVTNGEGPYSYQWSTGDTTAQLENLFAGTYYLTVTDINQARKIGVAEVLQVQESPEFEVIQQSCYGVEDASIEIMDNQIAYSYLWSTGDTSAVLDSLSPGQYSVTLTDKNNCQISIENIHLIAKDSLFIEQVHLQPAPCPGDQTNQAAIEVFGGSPPYTFQWSDGIEDSLRTNLTAGTYLVEINDQSFCHKTVAVEIEAQVFELSFFMDSTSCAEANDGIIIPEINGGNLPFTYQWSNGDTLASLEGLAPGAYGLTLTDATSCQIIDSIEVFSKASTLTIEIDRIQQIDENNLGAIEVTAFGLNNVYNYEWFHQDTLFSRNEDIDQLSPGTYYLKITDILSGCTMLSKEIEILDFTSLVNSQNNPCKISPNPSFGYLNLDCNEQIDRIEWLTLSGRLLKRSSLEGSTIYFESLDKGIYILRIYIKGIANSYKILKE